VDEENRGAVVVVRAPDELLPAARRLSESLPRYEATYQFTIVAHENYESLLSHSAGNVVGVEGLISMASKTGRVILHGGGGTGKTSILHQVIDRAVEAEAPAVIIRLNKWLPSLDTTWRRLGDSESGRIDLLLSQLGEPATTLEALSVAGETGPVLVLVDGLNECERGIGNDFLSSLSWFAGQVSQAGVIVTDRLSRRPVSNRWGLTAIGPLYGEKGLRGIAFFRDRLTEDGAEGASVTQVQRRFLKYHANLDDAEIKRAASAALNAYLHDQSRNFSIAEFESMAGDGVIEKLHSSDVLAIEGNHGRFQHHLYHDYLASVELASRGESAWTWEIFDAITFKGSSFDALAMALEQLPDEATGDELLRRIYDWNFYGTAYALSNANAASVRPDTEAVVTLVLGERRWDPFRSTVTQVTDALRLFETDLSRDVLSKQSSDEVRELAQNWVASEGPLGTWLQVFTVPTDASLTDTTVHQLEDDDSFLGWTLANTLKRVTLSSGQEEWLRDRLHNGDETVRWRAAHALGGHGSNETASALRAALSDTHYWVQYGALRSLIETAAEHGTLGDHIVTGLVQSLDVLVATPGLLAALERFLMLTAPPPNWATTVAPVIESLWLRASTEAELDRWKTLADRVSEAADGASVA
jgi:HEAT repeats